MTLYAAYDSTKPSPQRVIGWYDTIAYHYGANMPGPANLLEISPAQWNARLKDATGWAVENGTLIALPVTSTSVAMSLKDQAKAALDKTDRVVLRCVEHGVSFPGEWLTYRNTLRAIASGGTASALPTQPTYPGGS